MANSKIVLGDEVIIDLTGDTVTKQTVLAGATFHGSDGEILTGECDFDLNTQPATASVDEVLESATFGARGTLQTGRMPNRGKQTSTIKSKNDNISIQQGYHDGSGTVSIDASEKAKLIAENIKQGVTLLGVQGTHEGATTVTAQSKNATPSFSEQHITPDSGYDYLTEVVVAPIKVTRTTNASGGTTVTVG